MTELTFEEFCELRFEYRTGITFDTCTGRLYRNDVHGLQVEVNTSRNKRTGEWGKEKKYWFVDGDSRHFETFDQCYVAYMEKVCGVKAFGHATRKCGDLSSAKNTPNASRITATSTKKIKCLHIPRLYQGKQNDEFFGASICSDAWRCCHSRRLLSACELACRLAGLSQILRFFTHLSNPPCPAFAKGCKGRQGFQKRQPFSAESVNDFIWI